MKLAYKNLALCYHPDRSNSVDSADKFVAVREAWEHLSDPEAKTSYDAYLAERRYSVVWTCFVSIVCLMTLESLGNILRY